MKQLSRLFETRKLHYGKYLYKLVLSNSLSNVFRTELQKGTTLSHAKEKLDFLADQHKAGKPLATFRYRTPTLISNDEYLDALHIYNTLKDLTDYKVRTTYHRTLTIYSNDISMLTSISDNLYTSNIELWKPNKEYIELLTSDKNIIVVDKPTDMTIKVTFKRGNINKDFAIWVRANGDKCQIGQVTLNDIENDGYLYGNYMYVRNEKILNLVILLIGNSISRVDKIVYRGDIDKY